MSHQPPSGGIGPYGQGAPIGPPPQFLGMPPAQGMPPVQGVPPQAGPGMQPAPVYVRVVAPPQPVLPVVLTRYHHFFRTPTFRWWRSLLALLMGTVLAFLATLVVTAPVVVYEVVTGSRSAEDPTTATIKVTPPLFAANNVSLALLIPVAMMTMWACYRMRPKWLSSVEGGFRWSFFAKCLAVCVVPYAVMTTFEVATGFSALQWGPWSVFMIVTILITTPFQAAGEEYGLRGLVNRAVAAWVPQPIVGALLGGLVSSIIFMLLHGAGDIWLNIFYFLFGVIACRLAYVSGGLEAPVAFHVVNNFAAEVTMPFTDISDVFNRSAGTVSFTQLLPQLAVVTIAWLGMEWMARKTKVVSQTAPDAAPLVTEENSIVGPAASV